MTPAFRRIAIAAVAIALVAAACGGSDPNSETPADTVGYHGDPDLSYDDTGSDDDTDDDDTDDTDDAADHHDTGGEEDTGSGGGRHGSADAPTRYDADVADAAQTITVQVVGGSPVGGHQRVEVELGSVVALTITADTTEEVHVHGYDILRAVSDGHPTHFAFTARRFPECSRWSWRAQAACCCNWRSPEPVRPLSSPQRHGGQRMPRRDGLAAGCR